MKLNILYYIVISSFFMSCATNNKIIKNDTYTPINQVEYVIKSPINIPTILTKGYSSLEYNPLQKYEIEIKKEFKNIENINLSVSKVETESLNLILKDKVETLLNSARNYLGTPYRYGGTSYSGIDCSGFVRNSFNVLGINLPRTSYSQASEGFRVPLSEVKKGDLLFFSRSGYGVSHVGIVENIDEFGEVSFIHSATSQGVTITKLSDSYWAKRYKKAVRILKN